PQTPPAYAQPTPPHATTHTPATPQPPPPHPRQPKQTPPAHAPPPTRGRTPTRCARPPPRAAFRRSSASRVPCTESANTESRCERPGRGLWTPGNPGEYRPAARGPCARE